MPACWFVLWFGEPHEAENGNTAEAENGNPTDGADEAAGPKKAPRDINTVWEIYAPIVL